MNVELLQRVRDAIRANPTEVCGDCGLLCIMCRVVRLNGEEPAGPEDLPDQAREALGLSIEMAAQLFYLPLWPHDFKVRCITSFTDKEAVLALAEYIDYFIAKHAGEAVASP